jgi:hypothetical protein
MRLKRVYSHEHYSVQRSVLKILDIHTNKWYNFMFFYLERYKVMKYLQLTENKVYRQYRTLFTHTFVLIVSVFRTIYDTLYTVIYVHSSLAHKRKQYFYLYNDIEVLSIFITSRPTPISNRNIGVLISP